ncbi:MAG: hypothetical protein CMF96_03755 [Candidatus Marinimicrobia bacterium]|nr:hypothetical protein [Candidatus Neomarinimicrobiota bacterium]|tara:strand:+ start:4912 stop:6195 length:1284 start_codon:yes stop_codon:yes gene_type:complete
MIFTILYPFNFETQPSVYLEYYENGGEFTVKSQPIKFMGWSINTNYVNNNLNIESSFSAHGIDGYTPRNTDLNSRKGIPYLYNYMDNYDDLGIYWTSHVNIKFKKDNLIFEAGNKNRSIGSGNNSIFVSDKPNNYPSICFDWQVTPSVYFNFHYAFLDQSNNNVENNRIYSYKTMAIHQLVYNISDKFKLSLYESVIFDRYIDINYLNPFILYYPLSRHMGYNDNNQIGLELVFNLNKNKKYYFSLFIDEWDPDLTFKKYHENWVAYQFGSQIKHIFAQNDKLKIEYTWTDFRVYENDYKDVNYYLKGSSIGFWTGSHSEVLYFNYDLKYNKYLINLNYVNVIRGFQPENLIEVAYDKINFDRYSLGYEKKEKLSMNVNYKYNSLLYFGLSINHVNWILNSNIENNHINRFFIGAEVKYYFKELNFK